MSFAFTLQGQLPSGKNQVKITRTGHRYPSQRFVLWRAEALRQIGKVRKPLAGRVRMTVAYWPGDKRRRDAAGMVDALCHLLEQAGIVSDDAQIKELDWFEHAPGDAACTVQLEEVEG